MKTKIYEAFKMVADIILSVVSLTRTFLQFFQELCRKFLTHCEVLVRDLSFQLIF